YNAPAINGIQIASFLIFVGYVFFKKFEYTNKKKAIFLSGILFGISNLFWDSSFFLALFFIFIFFYNKKVKYLIIFLIAFFLSSSIRLIIDYILFGFPLFSLIRFFGGQVIYLLGLGPYGGIRPYQLIAKPLLSRINVFIVISPLLFLIYRTNFKKYKKEFLFIIFSLMLFFLFGPQIRYLVSILPISIVLLNTVIKKEEIKYHVISSIILFILLVPLNMDPNFNYDYIKTINKDLNSIAEDFPNERFIIGDPGLNEIISYVYWGTDIKEVIGWDEYLISTGNKSNYMSYKLESNSKINNERKLVITISLVKKDNSTYNDVGYLITTKDESPLEKFKLIKAYRTLKVYEREK
ncbi:MAG: hypothetical protein ACTSQG_09510, partial [Promethearchaeota archaeon]